MNTIAWWAFFALFFIAGVAVVFIIAWIGWSIETHRENRRMREFFEDPDCMYARMENDHDSH